MNNKHLKYVECELHRNGDTYYSLTAWYVGYGFSLEIVDLDTEKVVFKKFLRTQDTDYCANYLRKVARNNFGAYAA